MEKAREDSTLEEILKLKEKCSKKVFNSFISNSYKVEHKDTNIDKVPIKDDEFEKVFGCKRNKDYRPIINVNFLNPSKKTLDIAEEEKPEEMPAKYRPPKLRNVFDTNSDDKEDRRDPRFEKSSGFFNAKRFDKSYGFIKEGRNKDREILKKKLKKLKNEEKKNEISKVIQRIDNQIKSEDQIAKKQEIKRKLIEEKKKLLSSKNKNKEIQTKVFVNKSEVKKKELVEKFKELKKKSQLNKYLERKRKKNTGRERKLVFKED